MVSACGPEAVRERRRNRTKRRISPACAGRWSVAQADRDPAQGLVRHGESYWTWVHELRNIKGLQAGLRRTSRAGALGQGARFHLPAAGMAGDSARAAGLPKEQRKFRHRRNRLASFAK